MFKHITPITKNAQRFFDMYGGIFYSACGYRNNNPAVLLNTCENLTLFVEDRPDGVYVNDEKFCEEW